jgi:predicted amidohydrolase
MTHKLKVALIQYAATNDKGANLAQALGLAQKALDIGAEFILLPEIFNFRASAASNQGLFLKAREKIPGPSTQVFMALAKKYRVPILLGSILEKAPGASAYNTCVYIDSRGKIAAKYRKIHLFDARISGNIIRETDFFRPGQRPVTASIGPFKMGLSVCYDLRFPDLYQHYARRGVNILTVPSCFTKKTGEAHWEALLRARAIENLSYVLAPAQIGSDDRGIQAYGHSMIVSPWGEIIAQGSLGGEEIIFGEIRIEEIEKARQILPGIIK